MVRIICSESELEPATDRRNDLITAAQMNEIIRIILLDVTTAKHSIISTERENSRERNHERQYERTEKGTGWQQRGEI